MENDKKISPFGIFLFKDTKSQHYYFHIGRLIRIRFEEFRYISIMNFVYDTDYKKQLYTLNSDSERISKINKDLIEYTDDSELFKLQILCEGFYKIQDTYYLFFDKTISTFRSGISEKITKLSHFYLKAKQLKYNFLFVPKSDCDYINREDDAKNNPKDKSGNKRYEDEILTLPSSLSVVNVCSKLSSDEIEAFLKEYKDKINDDEKEFILKNTDYSVRKRTKILIDEENKTKPSGENISIDGLDKIHRTALKPIKNLSSQEKILLRSYAISQGLINDTDIEDTLEDTLDNDNKPNQVQLCQIIDMINQETDKKQKS